jgi:hypothetical protein
VAVRIFDDWLKKEVIKFNDHKLHLQRLKVDEASTQDLWRLATHAAHDVSTGPRPSEVELADALRKIETFIRKTYRPTSEQQEVITRNLEPLHSELSRRPDTDWRGVIIGALINIVTALYLNNEQGKQLLEFARRAFEASLRLLP